MKFPVDMNLSPAWVEFLARAGFEAVHWSQIGRSDAVDSDVMEWAAKHGQIVLTADLDFGAILAATRQAKPSVLQVRSDDLSQTQSAQWSSEAFGKREPNWKMAQSCL
jgi:predicted nuclease of predicted toxin-antitoxin system